MRRIVFVASVFAMAGAGAAPSVSDVCITPASRIGTYEIGYTLSARAVVTADILTNGVSIGAARFSTYEGDVFKLVEPGRRGFFWRMRKDWPDQKVAVQAKLTAWLPGAAPDYMVIDLKVRPGARMFYPSAEDVPLGVTDELYKTDMLVLRRVHASGVEWRMGQPVTGETCDANTDDAREADNRENETPHLVALTEDFYVGIYEVTQRQYYNVTGEFPSKNAEGSRTDHYEASKTRPVENVSYAALRGTRTSDFKGWPEAGHAVSSDSVIQTFREKTGVLTLDLPTEAQWEFACRAGTVSALNNGKECSDPVVSHADANAADIAWYGGAKGTGGDSHHPVGTKDPNGWGLYDMHGNVFEYCLDWLSLGDDFRATFAADWRTGGVTVDPVGSRAATTGPVVRGGDYFNSSSYLRSAARAGKRIEATTANQHYGFRLVCSGNAE